MLGLKAFEQLLDNVLRPYQVAQSKRADFEVVAIETAPTPTASGLKLKFNLSDSVKKEHGTVTDTVEAGEGREAVDSSESVAAVPSTTSRAHKRKAGVPLPPREKRARTAKKVQ